MTERRVLISVAALLLFLVAYLSLLLGSSFIDSIIVSEEGLYQNIGALALLTASVLCVLAFWRSRAGGEGRRRSLMWRISCLALAAVFFVGAGEEISWGQHLFNFGTPEQVEDVNAQGETNIHNLRVVREGAITPARLFFAFAALFMLIVPALATLHDRAARWLDRLVPVIPLFVGLLFVANYGISKVATILSAPPTRQPIKEIQEMNYALLLALASFYVLAIVRTAPAEDSPAARPGPLQESETAGIQSR